MSELKPLHCKKCGKAYTPKCAQNRKKQCTTPENCDRILS